MKIARHFENGGGGWMDLESGRKEAKRGERERIGRTDGED